MECLVQGIIKTQVGSNSGLSKSFHLSFLFGCQRMNSSPRQEIVIRVVIRSGFNSINRRCFVLSRRKHVEALEILLRVLCAVPKELLRIHELCLKSGPNLAYRTVQHIGGSMRGAGDDQISILVRNMVESKASNNVLRLFYALGYKLDHELLAFHFQRGTQVTVTVFSINKMLKLHATSDAVRVTPGMQLVEVTTPASSEIYSEVFAAISSICEHLAPFLHLSKPSFSTGVVPTAAAAAASLMSDGGGTSL